MSDSDSDSVLFANRPLILGRVSAYAFREAYRIVFSNFRFFLFSLYLNTLASRSIPTTCDPVEPLLRPNGYEFSENEPPSGTIPTSIDDEETWNSINFWSWSCVAAIVDVGSREIDHKPILRRAVVNRDVDRLDDCLNRNHAVFVRLRRDLEIVKIEELIRVLKQQFHGFQIAVSRCLQLVDPRIWDVTVVGSRRQEGGGGPREGGLRRVVEGDHRDAVVAAG
ncbi:2-oxoglutarate (2OG) and Fe(II)-dependent oxygenase superfamily protein [Striga asiatica]|uniref:2-oxoglutarate (2OG) and Fe(II)-dependent oxygenase superfamily protein n=1 Tax=Striga asiatica TaxID=4170 RepID=A0A5A7R3Y1_STRAF|nr:2-oxoglutarate (2OG) and Fe(II)-dependent oxygenase superfamily protein [Striga asiatica]